MVNADSNNISLDRKAKIKRLLNIFWALEAVLVIVAIQWLLKNDWQIPAILFLAIISILPVYFLAKKGKIEIGRNIILIFLTIFLLFFSWKYNGLRDEVIMVFPAVIMVSLLMGGQRLAIYVYLLVSANILAIGYLNEVGYIHNDSSDSNIEAAILLVIILSFISYIAWLISTEMRKTNKALRESKNELEKRVKQRTVELEKSIENLTNTQSQLIETEKMASLGRLVAGVAHEINTPIGIAITASSCLQDAAKELSKLYDSTSISKQILASHLDTTTTSTKLIRSNLKRAADLIQGFKEVAVDQSNDEIREFKLKHYVNEILASLGPQIKRSKCKIELNCANDLSIRTSPGAIAQIITNLVINSIIHAFEHIVNGLITINIEQKDKYISLQFKDSGCGISPKNLSNIFEPFFTTKRGKGGSGLGMHIVYNSVTQALQGNIECTSTLNEGTSFLIHFPCDITVTLPED